MQIFWLARDFSWPVVLKVFPIIIQKLPTCNLRTIYNLVNIIGVIGFKKPDLVKSAIPFLSDRLSSRDGSEFNVLMALENIGSKKPELLKSIIPSIEQHLENPAPFIRDQAEKVLRKLKIEVSQVPIEILKIRLAMGEISLDEYNKLKKVLDD